VPATRVRRGIRLTCGLNENAPGKLGRVCGGARLRRRRTTGGEPATPSIPPKPTSDHVKALPMGVPSPSATGRPQPNWHMGAPPCTAVAVGVATAPECLKQLHSLERAPLVAPATWAA
jgi:hypothetical protein